MLTATLRGMLVHKLRLVLTAMSGHGATIAAMVHRWAANGRRPCQYRYDDTADVIRWNIPESATGWFVFDPNTSDAGSAPRARSRPSGGTGAKRSRL